MKHGIGKPPVQRGVWFIKLQNHRWGTVVIYDAKTWGEWSDEVVEYFGPIPIEEWSQ